MKLTQSTAAPLSTGSCTTCAGAGMRGVNLDIPCRCVTRRIFTLVHARFREIQESGVQGMAHRLSAASSAVNKPGAGSRMSRQEFLADFILIAKRALSPAEFKVFRFHFLLGADWKLCQPRLRMDRGAFFHCVYRVQQKVGYALVTTEPYSLFPIDGYFGSSRAGGVQAFVVNKQERGNGIPVQPPLRQAA